MASNYTNGDVPRGRSVTKPTVTPDLAKKLRELRSLSPQESLGLNTGGGLMVPVMIATVGAAILMVVLTVIPYVIARSSSNADNKPATPTKPEAPAADTTPVTPQPKAVEPAAKKDAPELTPKPKDKKKDVLDALGESDVKKSNPKVNPFEEKEIDLFKK